MMNIESPQKSITQKISINATDIPFILDHHENNIKILSLDCFDTLIWRKTATPRDVFYAMQVRPAFQALQITAYQRIRAEARAYRKKWITQGRHEIKLQDIYDELTNLTSAHKMRLIQEELKAEIELCYAYQPMVDLIQSALSRGIKIIIVSNTYLNEYQLRELLSHCLPSNLVQAIHAIFCSSEYHFSKTNGLFKNVLNQINAQAKEILHIGSYQEADCDTPRSLGLQAYHFMPFDSLTYELFRMEQMSSALSAISNPPRPLPREARYNPFRALISLQSNQLSVPETLIGYATFGPLLYAFARFLTDEIKALQAMGKHPKVFFLMHDAYLLALSCEAYAGIPLGKPLHIQKFTAVAASFHTVADIDEYLLSLEPHDDDFWVICAQLLLPLELTQDIIRIAKASFNPEQTFNQLIHRADILQLIFKHSSAYRARLKRYIDKEMVLESHDTVVLVDVGYIGTTQRFLTLALKKDYNVEITGRYFITSHEPNRPDCKALITSTPCDHELFKQSCTYKEGPVLDYDEAGNPIFDKICLNDEQYRKIRAIQSEALRFIQEAMYFYKTIFFDYPLLQATSEMILKRHIYFPLEIEARYFQSFQNDKKIGHKLNKPMYNMNDGVSFLQQGFSSKFMHPYEIKMASLDIALSTHFQRELEFDILSEDKSCRHELLTIILVRQHETAQATVKAFYSYDDFYVLTIPAMLDIKVGIAFGKQYQWVQIESVKLIHPKTNAIQDLDQNLHFEKMINKNGNLFECESELSHLMMIPSPRSDQHCYRVIFRPIVRSTAKG